jgi:MFS family permease
MLQAGAFFGSLGVGPVADKYGRKLCLIGGAAIFIVGSVMQVVAAPHIPLLMAGRAIGGFGVGACSTLAPLYTSENVPAAIRGRMTACYQLFIQIGLMISFWINYGMAINHPSEPGQWQVSLALQILPGLILIGGMLMLHESPRFLLKQGQNDKAFKVLSWTRSLPEDHPYVAQEGLEIRTQLENEGMLVGSTSHFALWKEIFTIRSNRNRLALGLMLMVLQQLMGVNAINYCMLFLLETG